jgi:hypothetical protein
MKSHQVSATFLIVVVVAFFANVNLLSEESIEPKDIFALLESGDLEARVVGGGWWHRRD